MKRIFIAAFAVLVAHPVLACDYCMLYQGSSPLLINGLSVRIDSRYLSLHALYDHNVRVGNAFNQRETYFTTQVSAVIPMISDGSLLISVPITSRGFRHDTEGIGTLDALEPAARAVGIGDATALLRYLVLHAVDENMSLTGGLALGMKFPTGRTDARNDIGEYADAHIQPGTGSFDPLIGANIFAGAGLWGINWSSFCWFPGNGSRGYRFGTIANSELNAVLHVFPESIVEQSVFIGAGIGAEWHGEEIQNGNFDVNTGGRTVYVAPILRIEFEHFSVEVSGQVPLDHSLNGTQLGESFRFATGVQWRR